MISFVPSRLGIPQLGQTAPGPIDKNWSSSFAFRCDSPQFDLSRIFGGNNVRPNNYHDFVVFIPSDPSLACAAFNLAGFQVRVSFVLVVISCTVSQLVQLSRYG
jgi:hypothetical protein